MADISTVITVMAGAMTSAAADVNGDGIADISDVNLIINALLYGVRSMTHEFTVNGVTFTMVPVEGNEDVPAFAIALPKIAMTFKFMRSAIIEQNASEYVKTERSHGLSEARILLRHVLPNSNVSSITIITLVLSDILGGSLIVEQVFNLPGLGRLLLTAIDRRDFPLMSGMIFYLALITVILYFVSDILASIADPRIRLK